MRDLFKFLYIFLNHNRISHNVINHLYLYNLNLSAILKDKNMKMPMI
jgi:hypothetical protein